MYTGLPSGPGIYVSFKNWKQLFQNDPADQLCALYLLQLLRQTGTEEIPEGSQIRRKREAIPADRYSQ